VDSRWSRHSKCCLGSGLILVSQIQAPWQLYLFYGGLAGIGMSAAYVPCTATAVKWFRRRRGLAVGIAGSGASLGIAVVPPLSEALLVHDATDWYKYFKCSEIDPTCLPGEVVHAERQAGLRRLFLYKIRHYPLQVVPLLRRFPRYMPVRDIAYLLLKPFLGNTRGATQAEVLSRAVEHRAMKDAAAR
jgi:MFS family permease